MRLVALDVAAVGCEVEAHIDLVIEDGEVICGDIVESV
jgi:hypothetical protein